MSETKDCNLGSVMSRFKNSDFVYEVYTNGTRDFKIKITHSDSGYWVDNSELNLISQYKTRQILIFRLAEKLILNGL